MPSAHLVLTVIARDQPGIVEALSQTIADHGANWLGSHMARLSGEFAGIVEVSLPDTQLASLREGLTALEGRGLRIQVQESREAAAATRDARRLRLELVGNDRPGIVREISQALARRAVNVYELETSCESAAMSGDVLFRAAALVDVPAELPLESLREDLEKIASDLMVDLNLEAD